jgi:GDP-4-dehydro-6-deoxy-D-mannose reductase
MGELTSGPASLASVSACDLLVTGAKGFVGRHLVEHAASVGLLVQAADWDLRDAPKTAERVARIAPRAVAHLAAAQRIGSPWEWLCDDLRMAGSLLAAMGRHAPLAPLLVAGSAAQYGMGAARALREDDPTEPVSAYGAAKCTLERAVTSPALRCGVRVIWARSFNHVGPGQGADAPAGQWARQVALAEQAGAGELRTGALDVVRDFLDVRDVAAAYLALLRSDAEGVVNVASGAATGLRELVDLLLERSTVALTAVVDPALRRGVDPPYVVGDPARLRALTAWRPRISLARSVGDLLDECRGELAASGAAIASGATP